MSKDSTKKSFLNVQLTNTNHAMAALETDFESSCADKKILNMEMPLEQLACSEGYSEFWGDDSDIVESGEELNKNMKWVRTEHHLMISFQFSDLNLFEKVDDIYTAAYAFSEQLGFACLLRTWNYIDRINVIENDQERYQTFCVARHQALARLDKLQAPNPAATAIGGINGQNNFVFLFSHNPGIVVENKRQISAWNYPEKYAPKQPRFSRAMQYGDLLMCSGTASVIGHETIHLNDLGAQLEECLINIGTLLEDSSLNNEIGSGMYRFYLRDSSHLSQVLEQLKRHDIDNYVILAGDVCRDDLLIECEAVFQ